jgi:mannose-6-phosphate isomerase-like protein (cupin superfamily)
MHWIDEQISEHKAREQRKSRIRSEAPKLFDALWSYILEDIKHANQTDHIGVMQIITEGSPSQREMVIIKPASNEPKEVRVHLSEDKHTIIVSGAVQVKFQLRPNLDGSVCLKDGRGQIDFKEASREILDPLIFPSLQKPEFS